MSVQIMLSDGNISDAQGSVLESRNSGTRGVVYGYDDLKVRIWGSNIAVFGASDGWGLYTEDTKGTARILAWKTNKQGRIFYKKITVSKSSKEESVLRFPRYFDLSNYLIKVQVKVPNGDNRNMIFQSVGSSVATGINLFSGIVYVYTTTEILFWKPVSYNGHMFFIGDVFGSGHHSQICDTVDLHVEVYYLKPKVALEKPGSISKPSFESVWCNIQAQNSSFPYLKIQHDLGEYPVKVDVQIKITLNGTNFIFTGFGSAHRDDDFNERYGGVVYLYNTHEVILTFPLRFNNFAKGGVAFTGLSNDYKGPQNIHLKGPYMNGAAKVRVWLAKDFPSAAVNKTVYINTSLNFQELYHGLGSYPDILYVQIMLSDGNISDAQGSVFEENNNDGTRGVIYGYDDHKVRIWGSNIAVFGASDGWGLLTEDTEGTARIIAWKTNKQGRVFHKSLTVSKSSKEESVLRFPRYYGLSNYLIQVKIKVPNGNNTDMIFQSVGSSVASGLKLFSGIVYVYTTTEIFFWKPISYKGHMFFIGDVFGSEHYSQICDTVDLHVEVYHLESKGTKKEPPLPKPVIKVSTYNVNDSSVDRVQFECYLNLSTLNFAYYEVTWRWADSILSFKNESSQFPNLRLTDKHFKTLGVYVTCTVTAFHSKHDTIGSNVTSDKFYAGLMIAKHATVAKGGTVYVPYYMTIPIGCTTDEICGLNINVMQIEGNSKKACTGHLFSIPRVNETVEIGSQVWNISNYFELKHVGRTIYGVEPSSFTIILHIDLSKTIFTKYMNIPNIHISVRDSPWDRKMCSAHNDPHMTTFDGLRYEHQQPGTYIMYEHAISERHMQVQIELTPCGSTVFCICGLAVRAGADIFIIHLCSGKVIIKYASCIDNILVVKRAKRNTKRYKIKFPTGTEIFTDIFYGTTMNVDIKASGDDEGQSQGLCGRMSGDMSRNLLIRETSKTCQTSGNHRQKYPIFSNSWKVENNENLFHLHKDQDVERWKDVNVIPHENKINDCNDDRNFKIVTGSNTCATKYTPIIPISYVRSPLPTLTGTEVNWNKTAAQKYCTNKIRDTDAFKECSTIKGVDWNNFYDMCWNDILDTGSTMWTKPTYYSQLNMCAHAPHGNNTSILERLCPDNCSSHGECIEAYCICNDQFLGVDCSVSIYTPPMITNIFGIEHDGRTWCNKANTNCKMSILFGYEIEQAPGITCKITKFLVLSNNTYIHISENVVNATVQSFAEMRCPLIDEKTVNMSGLYVEEFSVSVSYNRYNYSQHMRLNVFDGNCHNINQVSVDNVVELMEDTCFIDNQCYLNEETHPQNINLYCNAPISPFEWTFHDVDNCIIEDHYFSRNDLVFGKECLFCDPDVTSYNWTLSENYCIIDGKCVKHGDKNNADECLLCNTKLNRFGWTKPDKVCTIQVSKPSDAHESSSELGLILIGSIGSLIVLLIVGFVANSYVKYKRRPLNEKTVSSYDLYDTRRLPRSNT
ncbi:uncharacterized protein LOC143081066 [Mytilus galloprovincialis]|uniref:uncharacterized protein LOC143081066 n=1 Tax=Mytilus galloprovincialis TaxID=29158 RepID=UPI003F7B6788